MHYIRAHILAFLIARSEGDKPIPRYNLTSETRIGLFLKGLDVKVCYKNSPIILLLLRLVILKNIIFK